MSRNQRKAGLALTAGLLLAFAISCSSGQDFDGRLGSLTAPYRFNTLKWEASAFASEAARAIRGGREYSGNESSLVTGYFASVQRIAGLRAQTEAMNAGLKTGDPAPLQAELERLQPETASSRATVERIIKRQISQTLAEQGIYNPADGYIKLRVTFPLINFAMQEPPRVLVVSTRDRIQKLRSITLEQGLSLKQTESIEDSVDRLGVSSLVVELGGFAGTYPTFVSDRSGLRSAIETIAHEWLHQYLAFKPLGFAYILDLTGISVNYDVVTINETAASMFGREIASLVYQKYYGGSAPRGPRRETEFDRVMRDLRKTVDQLLAGGEVEQAEKLMEQTRESLATKGYYIRKLNQAYFAFHGTYADSPASINPIGSQLSKLRSQQKSLKDFLAAVSVITSRQELMARTQ